MESGYLWEKASRDSLEKDRWESVISAEYFKLYSFEDEQLIQSNSQVLYHESTFETAIDISYVPLAPIVSLPRWYYAPQLD